MEFVRFRISFHVEVSTPRVEYSNWSLCFVNCLEVSVVKINLIQAINLELCSLERTPEKGCTEAILQRSEQTFNDSPV